MRRKGPYSTLRRMSTMGIVGFACLLGFIFPGAYAEVTPSSTSVTSDSATCQCGVFLLGTGTLTFSADAKPVLAGTLFMEETKI